MGKRRRFRVGDRVLEHLHGPGTVAGIEPNGYFSVKYDAGVWFKSHGRRLEPLVRDGARPEAGSSVFTGGWEDDMETQPSLTREPELRTRAELVAILEELRNVLSAIDGARIDRRYVDFGALAERLQECIDRLDARLPGGA